MRIRPSEEAAISYAAPIATGILSLLLGTVEPAAAQNSTGMLTPFSTGHNPTGLLTPFSTTTPPPMLKPGGGDHGSGGHHGHHEFPVFVTPFFGGFVDDNNMQVQITPVNPQPFTPAESPPPGQRPVAPYKPPSVEVAPGGIEIVRGPGQ